MRPEAGLINIGGTLYGTTFGKSVVTTVFSMNTTGSTRPCTASTARRALDALLDVTHTLAPPIAAHLNGVVFSVTATGVETWSTFAALRCSHPSRLD